MSASARQLLAEDHRRFLFTPAHLGAGDLGGGPEHQHIHAPAFPLGGGIDRLDRVLGPAWIQGFCQPSALAFSICSMIRPRSLSRVDRDEPSLQTPPDLPKPQ
ncbi:MAG TPA: hypothetical protein VER57_01435 [Cyanobium sp.]|nr:hypothetical protein [Cyanobium sp.]